MWGLCVFALLAAKPLTGATFSPALRGRVPRKRLQLRWGLHADSTRVGCSDVVGDRLRVLPQIAWCDRNERDFRQPIVSVSLGLPAVFLWGGSKRSDRTVRVPLCHGDVVVWGGPARLRYHGVSALKNGEHPLTGCCRVNLTFRQAG